MTVKVLGPGCNRCVSLERATRQAIGDVIRHRQMRKERVFLKNHAHPSLLGRSRPTAIRHFDAAKVDSTTG